MPADEPTLNALINAFGRAGDCATALQLSVPLLHPVERLLQTMRAVPLVGRCGDAYTPWSMLALSIA